MSLNPYITKETSGKLTLRWTPDPNAKGYTITTPTGSALKGTGTPSSNLGVHDSITVTISPLYPQAAETAVYPVAPPPAALLDLSAARFTSLPDGGTDDAAHSVPSYPNFCIYQNSDITLTPDATWGKAFRVHIHQEATRAASSHNPWGMDNPWHQVPNSAELCYDRTHTEGEVLWYAQAIKVPAGAHFPTRNEGWSVFTQLCYPSIISPPLGLEMNAAGFGIDRDSGISADISKFPKVRMQVPRLTLAAVTGKWLRVVVGAKWTVASDGWVKVLSKLDGEPDWTLDYQASGPTYQQVTGKPIVTGIAEKNGGYIGWFSGDAAVGYTVEYLLRGLSLHTDQAGAEAALA